MIAASLDRVAMPPIAVVAITTVAGSFTMPPPDLPGELAPTAPQPVAKAAATIDVSHLMVPVELLPLARPIEATGTAETLPPAPVTAEASTVAAVPRKPAAAQSIAVARDVEEAAPPAIRRHTGVATASTAGRRHKLLDTPITTVAGVQALTPPLAPQVVTAIDRVSPASAEPIDTIAPEPRNVLGAGKRAVAPVVSLSPAPMAERAAQAPATLPTADAQAPSAFADVEPVASLGDFQPAAQTSAIAAATVVSRVQSIVPPVVLVPREIEVKATSLDDALRPPISPVFAPDARQALLPTDLATATPAVISPAAAATAVTIPAPSTVAVPPPPALPAPRRDPPGGPLPGVSRERIDPPVYASASPPPPPPPTYAGDAHQPVPPPVAPEPPPSRFAIETPSLGAVRAEVTRRDHPSGDALHVHFAVDRSGTAALIAGASDDLERAVVATGNRLDAVTIEVRGGTTAATGGSDPAGGAGHRGDAPQHRAPAPTPPAQAPSTRVRSPAIKPVVRDRFA